MAKKKSQKKISTFKENPFNIKVNRNKHNVLGQRLRGTRGLPGVSHSAGNAKRKEMFHKKKLMSQKANYFLDKRIMDNSLTSEEQATARLVQERKKKLKKSIFNLNDDETLTHKGMAVDKGLKDNILNSDDDDEQLDPNFIKQAHFGGFADDSTSTGKSRKEVIDELIADSKKRKHEQKLTKELNADLIEKLDKEWKAMHSSLPVIKVGNSKETVISEKNDPFDVVMQELKFDMRTTPTNRLKKAEEVEKEEREKTKKLEQERHKRMVNPMDAAIDENKQLSADSIYDGIDLQFEPIIENSDDKETSQGNMDFSSDDGSSGNSDSEDEYTNINEIIDNHSLIITEKNTEIPDTKEKFYSILENEKEKDVSVVIECILKANIKNKTKQNLQKLETFFAVLIEYVMGISNCSKKSFEVLDSIIPHLFTLAEISPVNTAQKLLNFLDKEQDIFQKSKGRKLKKNFPRLSSLLLFKVCSVLYSVSDFKHPVVTPAIIFMCDILSSAHANSFINTYFRLIICKILYDCVSYSKRYVPEVIWFLNKTLPLIGDEKNKFNLNIDESVNIKETAEISEENILHCDDSSKVKIIYEIFELLSNYSNLYVQLPSFCEIFSESLNICHKLCSLSYPKSIKDVISKFITTVESVKHVYKPLAFENRKPIPLKLFEPVFDSKYVIKKNDIRKKRKLAKRVEQKIRKEEKGLLREMRRDNQVIASEKLKEKIEADDERKRKVKQLYQELAMQEGEYKKFIKKK